MPPCFEILAYTAIFCLECFFGRRFERIPTPPPSPKIAHYNLNEDLEPCPYEIPERIDWEVVDHDD